MTWWEKTLTLASQDALAAHHLLCVRGEVLDEGGGHVLDGIQAESTKGHLVVEPLDPTEKLGANLLVREIHVGKHAIDITKVSFQSTYPQATTETYR